MTTLISKPKKIKVSTKSTTTPGFVHPRMRLATPSEVKKYMECRVVSETDGLYATSDFESIKPTWVIPGIDEDEPGSDGGGREPKGHHARSLADSMLDFDCKLVNISLVITSLFNKNREEGIFNIDGGHRRKAAQILMEDSIKRGTPGFLPNGNKIELMARVYVIDDTDDYVELVIKLNNNSKPFNNMDYLNVHSWNGKTDYSIVKDTINQLSIDLKRKFPMELVVCSCTNGRLEGDAFRHGDFKIIRDDYQEIISFLIEMMEALRMPKVVTGRAMLSIIMADGYPDNHNEFITELYRRGKNGYFTPDEKELKRQLQKVYADIFQRKQ